MPTADASLHRNSYQVGDYVCPTDLPGPVVYRVARTLHLSFGAVQVLELDPFDSGQPLLVRLDKDVRPAPTRQLWRSGAAIRRHAA